MKNSDLLHQCLTFLSFCLQDPEYCIEITTRWFEGLIKKDIDVMNEIYSLDSVDFDRQVRSLSFPSLGYFLNIDFQLDDQFGSQVTFSEIEN